MEQGYWWAGEWERGVGRDAGVWDNRGTGLCKQMWWWVMCDLWEGDGLGGVLSMGVSYRWEYHDEDIRSVHR